MMVSLTPQLQNYQQRVQAMRQSSAIDYPAHVHLETLARCNAACNFCPYPGIDRQGEKMSDALIAKVVDDLADIPRLHAFQLSPFKVNEPFLDVRLFDLIGLFQERLPQVSITLTTNASPITEKTLARLATLRKIGYLWISFNDHREEEYEAAMQLPWRRTIERLQMIHRAKASGQLQTRVVLSRVSDGTAIDAEFARWVKQHYPLFEASLFPRGEWLGQTGQMGGTVPSLVGCSRWFDVSITATGVVAHCCMDGKAEFPIGDVRAMHVLDIYNQPNYRRLRAAMVTRQQAEPCRSCSFL